MIPLMIPMIGAGLGALTNKKNPLQGAILGGGLGALGSTVAPAVSGMFGSTPAAGSYAADAVGTASGYGGFGAVTNGPAASGTTMKGLLDTAGSVGQAASAASGLLGGGQQVQSQAPQFGGGGDLSQLYASIQQGDAQANQYDMQNRAKQQELLKRFGGGYGAA